MTNAEMAHIIATTVQFIGIVIGGAFAVELGGMWLRNKREQRTNSVKEWEARTSGNWDKERESWLQIIAEKDREIEELKSINLKLEKHYDIATKVLAVAERKEA